MAKRQRQGIPTAVSRTLKQTSDGEVVGRRVFKGIPRIVQLVLYMKGFEEGILTSVTQKIIKPKTDMKIFDVYFSKAR